MNRLLMICLLTATYLHPKINFGVEIKNLSMGNENFPAIDVLMMNSSKNKKIGAFAWIFVNESWAEGYGGLTYMPSPYLQLGFGLGLERANNPWRIGNMIWVGKEDWSVLSLFEAGGSGYWHQINAIYHLNKNIGIGLMKEEFTGFGPRLELTIPQLPIQLWVSFLQLEGKINKYYTIKFLF
jgi:hypothetical protein